jgi:hypothetical protein
MLPFPVRVITTLPPLENDSPLPFVSYNLSVFLSVLYFPSAYQRSDTFLLSLLWAMTILMSCMHIFL